MATIPWPRIKAMPPGAVPDGAPIYVILDNLSANKTPAILRLGRRSTRSELCFTPDLQRRGPTRSRRNSGRCATFVIGGSDHPEPHGARLTACGTTWPGATPTPATLTCSPPSPASGPASGANASNAGAGPGPKPHDQPQRTFLAA